MKLNIGLLLSLGQLAAAGQALDTRDGTDTQCYVFDAVDNERTLDFNTFSACAEECLKSDQFVIAMRISGCFCLDSMPPDDKKVDASECTEPCPGYARHICELCFPKCGTLPGDADDQILTNPNFKAVVAPDTTL